MPPESPAANPYDEVPFPSQPLDQADPARLAAVAMLFNLDPAPAERARVLELGCATGGNLLPLAERYPGGRFVGVDYSKNQIATASRMAADVGLKNVELRHLNIADIDDNLGQFDYIICHGVFSWVARDVQEKILEVCRARLRPQGLAYLSYNIYPLWHVHNLLRELLCRQTPASDPPARRAAEGRKLLEFLSWALAEADTPSSQLLKSEIDTLLKESDGYLLHEHLETENNPLYFHEFVARAAAHRLRYLADADVGSMFVARFGPAVEQGIARVALDDLDVEQHLDVLRNRGFRLSLVCRDDLPQPLTPTWPRLERMYFVASMRPENPAADLRSTEPLKFVTRLGSQMWSPVPLVKAAFCQLGERWPEAVSFDHLLIAAAHRLGTPEALAQFSPAQREQLIGNLAQCTVQGIAEIRSTPDSFVRAVSPRPVASALARRQARDGDRVTNRRHRPILLDEMSRLVLEHLDGTHDHAALVQLVFEAANQGKVAVTVNGVPARPGEFPAEGLREWLEHTLARLAQDVLLIQ